MNETKTLAEWISALRIENIPNAVRKQATGFVLDNLGCQIAGATLPWSEAYYDVIRKTRTGHHSTVAYFGDKFSPDDAAFLNSAFNHANESDGTHLKSSNHPGSVAVPAALAMAEYSQASGSSFLAAVIAAYEVQIRIAWTCAPHLIERGHHPPVGVGPFGAAAAAAVLLGFDSNKSLHALGIAGSHSGGLVEYVKTGGSVKRIHSAIPTAAGVRAALFAEAGITGPSAILEGEKGFFKVFAGEYELGRLTENLGTTYHLQQTSLKAHSSNHLMQAAFDALDTIRDKDPFSPADVRELIVHVASERIRLHVGSVTEPSDILGAQFSLPFSIAMRLHHGGRGVRGGNGFWDYPRVQLKNPVLIELARKVKCIVAPVGEWLTTDRAIGVEVTLNDGRQLRGMVPYSKGMPENPMSEEEIKDKFYSLVDPVLPHAQSKRIVEMVDAKEKLSDIRDLARLVAAPKKAS